MFGQPEPSRFKEWVNTFAIATMTVASLATSVMAVAIFLFLQRGNEPTDSEVQPEEPHHHGWGYARRTWRPASGAETDTGRADESVSASYFNKPDILYVDEPTEIKLIIVEKEIDGEKLAFQFTNLDGEVEEKDVAIESYLKAQLSAPAGMIDIKAINDGLQEVAKGKITYFTWFATPRKLGTIPIRLDLFTQKSPGNDQLAQPVEVMQEKWYADARGVRWLTYNLEELDPVTKAIAGAGGAVVAFLGFFGIKSARDLLKTRGNDQSKSEPSS
jgi:hypothetical protein